jgi:Na+-transporting NADH:ubiquinone oxidoreductase subunit NqrD
MYAHASGFNWDEGLMVLAPIALVAGLLIWARRREAKTTPANSSETKQR